jgi:hypothetical protein
MGAADVDFALAKPGMFRLMFSPLPAARRDDEELQAAAGAAFATLNCGVGTRAASPPSAQIPAAAIAAWSLVHGLSRLILDGAPPKSEAEMFKRAILAPPVGERSAWTTPP